MSLVWKSREKRKQRILSCSKCQNPLLMILWGPVTRQARILGSHHVRVMAKCPICKSAMTINFGGPTNKKRRSSLP